jgi:ArsR family transcriptional regulator, arsenate/arsenite/antimonite-responsive transcriptional repressor
MFFQNPRDERHELTDHYLALANPTRLRILEELGRNGEENVNDLALHLHMSQPRISWHLRMLRVGGVVRTRRDGRQVYCSLDVDGIAHARELLDELIGIKERMSARR